ncbi:hypothetical protein CRUP_015648, partial [Coryphaenoides rupestris]
MSVTEMFADIQLFLSADQDIREDIRKVVQLLEQTAREILTLLQSVHQPTGFKEIPNNCAKARDMFCTIRTHMADLKTKFPAEQYYRFQEHWRFVLQRLAFLAAFVGYLESETLVTREERHAWSGWPSADALLMRLSSSGYLVTRCSGAIRKERRFMRRSA